MNTITLLDPATATGRPAALLEQVRRGFGATPKAGVTDEEIAETIGHVALNVLTNYFNKAMGVEIYFPPVPD